MWQTQTSLLPSSARMRSRVLSASALNDVLQLVDCGPALHGGVCRFIYSS